MANLFRLIALFVLGAPALAFAAGYSTSVPGDEKMPAEFKWQTASGGWVSSASEACATKGNATVIAESVINTTTQQKQAWCDQHVGSVYGNYVCELRAAPGSFVQSLIQAGEPKFYCWDVPQKDCAPLAGKAGPSANSWYFAGVTTTAQLPGTFCPSGDQCQVYPEGASSYARVESGVVKGVGWGNPSGGGVNTRYSGVKCSASDKTATSGSAPNAKPEADPLKCAETGGAWGQVNGVNVCQPQTKKPDGKSVTSSSKSVANADGTTTITTTQTETTCADGLCQDKDTVTTKTIGADGKEIGTGTKTETLDPEKKDTKTFCAENPTSPICQGGQWGAVDCGAVPVCDGDPVQCATARHTFELKCAMGMTDGKSFAEQQMAAAQSGPVAGAGSSEMDVGAILNNSHGSVNVGGSCPPNFSISALGHSYAVDMSKYCEALTIGGWIVLAIASIISMRIFGS